MTPAARVTGFGPFGDVAVNPSSTVAASLAARLRERGWDASAETLPVTFAAAETAPSRLLATCAGPVWLLHVGVAATRGVISLERVATALVGRRADTDGVVPPSRVDAVGPARRTTFDVASLAPLVRAPFAVEISDDAGDYVCNATYFHALGAVASRADARALFIHVPPMSDADARSVGEALAFAVAALTACPTAS